MNAKTDKNIITQQVVINGHMSSHLIPITADEKCIYEIQNALTECDELKAKVRRYFEIKHNGINGYDELLKHRELQGEIIALVGIDKNA